MTKSDKCTVNLADLADELDLNEDSIRRHIRRGAPHLKRQGRLWFDPAAYVAWMKSENLTGKPHRTAEARETTPGLEAARLRKENALAEKYELQTARERGELMPADGVQKWIMEHIGALQTRLMALGDEIAPRLEGRSVGERADLVNGRVRELLTELSDNAKRLGVKG